MCPMCYVPWFVAILSALGLTGAHIWLDENQFALGVGVGLLGPALIWSIYKLYKYFKNRKECKIKK